MAIRSTSKEALLMIKKILLVVCAVFFVASVFMCGFFTRDTVNVISIVDAVLFGMVGYLVWKV